METMMTTTCENCDNILTLGDEGTCGTSRTAFCSQKCQTIYDGDCNLCFNETSDYRLPKRITANILRRLRACEEGIKAFAAVFPRGASVTPEMLHMAFEAGLDLDFLSFVLGCKKPSHYDAISALHQQYREREITRETKCRAGRQIGLDAILRELEAQK